MSMTLFADLNTIKCEIDGFVSVSEDDIIDDKGLLSDEELEEELEEDSSEELDEASQPLLIKLVRTIGENKWFSGIRTLLNVGRERFKDLIVELKYDFTTIENTSYVLKVDDFQGAWVYFIASLYDELNQLKYYKITAYVDADIAYKIHNDVYGFDVIDYLLRAQNTWKSKNIFIEEHFRETAIV